MVFVQLRAALHQLPYPYAAPPRMRPCWSLATARPAHEHASRKDPSRSFTRSGRQEEGHFDGGRATPDITPEYFAAVLRLTAPARPLPFLKLPQGTPARPVRWRSANGIYMIEELTHPYHVMAEGIALRHCIDSIYHADMEKHGVTAGTFASAYYLQYWLDVRAQKYRLFSFADTDGPLVTIALHRQRRVINQLGPRKGTGISADDVFFPYLIQAILHLSRLHAPLVIGAKVFPWADVLKALDGKVGITLTEPLSAYTIVQRMAWGLR